MNTNYKFAWKEDDAVLYMDASDCKYVAKNGNLAWRINNPGLIKHHCHYAKKNGSIGAFEKFAIFSNPLQGHQALREWLRSKTVFQSDLYGLGKHYQPTSPEQFAQNLASSLGIHPKITIKELTQPEFETLLAEIEKLCGFLRTGNEEFLLLPKIAARIECLDKHEEEIIQRLSYKDAIHDLDCLDSNILEKYIQDRCNHYKNEFEKISTVTVLDSGALWEHSFNNENYQNALHAIIEKYRKIPPKASLKTFKKSRVESFARE